MALIHYLPDEIEIEANEGETILLAALRAGNPMPTFVVEVQGAPPAESLLLRVWRIVRLEMPKNKALLKCCGLTRRFVLLVRQSSRGM